MKCYLSDNLAFDSEDDKQLHKARREAASSKRKREANKHKGKKKQLLKVFLFRKSTDIFRKSNEGQFSYKN